MLAEVGEACLQRLGPKARDGMELLPYVAGKDQSLGWCGESEPLWDWAFVVGSGRAECELHSPCMSTSHMSQWQMC